MTMARTQSPGRKDQDTKELVVGGGAAAVPLQLLGLLNDWVQVPSLTEAAGLIRAAP